MRSVPLRVRTPLRRVAGRLGRIAGWSVLAAGACLVLVAPLYVIVQVSVNAQLGFDYATPQISMTEEPFLITRVVSGKPMARAGLCVDDRVLFDDVSKLYALLIGSQGSTADIPIMRGRQPRIVNVRVPRLRLPLPAALRRLMYAPYAAARRRLPRNAS